ncbi:Ig-like domain-containing protein [Methanobrevibacter millerae]|uniref:Adhesin-like protein n=1 Tax=Methanobrevibacter millerae TaxID=230361 RepID=A0A1G5WQE0_9EURY|nr:Ig-like domain repeat protein [Methanobrevibacter millerae]SDA60154.1 hypothetical protein SAMN02910315_01580 [Methanobrevibacter millerae]
MKRLTIICFMILIFVLCISATYASENDTDINENIINENNFVIESNINNENFVKLLDDGIAQKINKSQSDSQIIELKPIYTNLTENCTRTANLYPTLCIQSDIVYQGTKLNFYMIDENNNMINLNGESIDIGINGRSYTRTFDENGIASLNINLLPGSYSAIYLYHGNNNYVPCYGTSTINVTQKSSIVVPYSLAVHTGNTGYGFKTKLIDEFGVPISNRTVHITIHGVTYLRTSDEKGIASLNINLPADSYSMSIWYEDENKGYASCSPVSWTLYVLNSNNLNQPIISSTTSIVPTGSQFQVKLTNSNGNGLSGKSIIVTIGNNLTTITTNSNGIATYTIPTSFNNGYYAVTMNFIGDTNYKSATAYKLLLIPNLSYSNTYSTSDPNGGTEYTLDYYKTEPDSYCNYSSNYVTSLKNSLISSCSDDLEKAISIQA